MSEGLDTLLELKDKMESTEIVAKVDSARVLSPAKEVESALTTFVTSRLQRLESDAQFEDLIKMHIRGRLPEFSIDQLLQLQKQLADSNNRAVESVTPMFTGDSGGKVITEHLRDSDVSSTAQNLYNTADKDMLQAISYLGSVIGKINERQNVIATN